MGRIEGLLCVFDAVNLVLYYVPEALADLVPPISAACLQPWRILEVCALFAQMCV